MNFSLTNYNKYIKFLLLSLGVFCISCDSNNKNIKEKNVLNEQNAMPFSDKDWFIPAGTEFPHEFFTEFGKKESIAELSGNVVILGFSTTWCHNCPQMLESLNALQRRLNKDDVKKVKIVVLNIGNDSLNELKIKNKAYDLPLLDVYKSIPKEQAMMVTAVPMCLIFGKDGKSLGGYIGAGADFSSDAFVTFIKKISN